MTVRWTPSFCVLPLTWPHCYAPENGPIRAVDPDADWRVESKPLPSRYQHAVCPDLQGVPEPPPPPPSRPLDGPSPSGLLHRTLHSGCRETARQLTVHPRHPGFRTLFRGPRSLHVSVLTARFLLQLQTWVLMPGPTSRREPSRLISQNSKPCYIFSYPTVSLGPKAFGAPDQTSHTFPAQAQWGGTANRGFATTSRGAWGVVRGSVRDAGLVGTRRCATPLSPGALPGHEGSQATGAAPEAPFPVQAPLDTEWGGGMKARTLMALAAPAHPASLAKPSSSPLHLCLAFGSVDRKMQQAHCVADLPTGACRTVPWGPLRRPDRGRKGCPTMWLVGDQALQQRRRRRLTAKNRGPAIPVVTGEDRMEAKGRSQGAPQGRVRGRCKGTGRWGRRESDDPRTDEASPVPCHQPSACLCAGANFRGRGAD